MSGIAKSAGHNGEPYVVPPPVHGEPKSITTTQYDGIPVDVYRFFGEQIGNLDGRDKDKLIAISDWAFKGSDSIGDGLMKLRSLEMKLGSPSLGEKRYDRLFNWVKMQKQIEDMQQRQEALRKV